MMVNKEIRIVQGKRRMSEWLEDPNVQLVAGLVVLCILTAIGFSLVSRFRDYAAHDRDTAVDALANLEEIHLKGDISEEEFRTIQAKAETLSQSETSFDDATSPDNSSVSSQKA